MKILLFVIPLLLFCCSFLAQAQTRVVCVGNSITEGYGLSNSGQQAYPAQLAILLGPGYKMLNCGVSGSCMVKNDPASYWKTNRFNDAKNFDPQIVIIKLGTNDGDPPRWNAHKNEFYNDYVAMIAEFRKNGRNPIIYVCYPVPTFGAAKAPQGLIIKNEVIPLIKQVATSQGLRIIDFNTTMQSYPEFFPDGIHPNAEGAKKMAEIAFNAMNIPLVNGIYELEPQHALGKRLDVAGWNAGDNGVVEIYGSNNGNNQRWKLIDFGNNIYELEPQHALGKRLDVVGANATNETKVVTYTRTGGLNQRWKLIAVGNGIYELEPQHAIGKRLDVAGWNTADKAIVEIYASNGGQNQRWKLALIAANALKESSEESSEGTVELLSNHPNPFYNETIISFQKPNESSKASIVIHNSMGKLLKEVNVSDNNTGYIVLSSSDLLSGEYIYTLVADGKSLSSKRFIVLH